MLEGKTKFGKGIEYQAFINKTGNFDKETDVLFFVNKDFDQNNKSLNSGSIQEGKKFMRITYGRGTEITEWIKEHGKYAPGELYVFNHSIRKFEVGVK